VDLRTRHVVIDGSSVRAYCSDRCAHAERLEKEAPRPREPASRPVRRLLPLALAVPVVLLSMDQAPKRRTPSASVTLGTSPPVLPVAPPEPELGPSWPPSENDWAQVIAKDAWIHPLSGPHRRMPIRDARVFGAERPGDRPVECRSGHCGVDIGGEVWGEPVLAAHDGVIDRVQRGPNEEHGGLYVRVAHRGGQVFTQYFHLAAIPRALRPGSQVKVGEVIGLVGDSGVKHSSAHLHFTISVKPGPSVPERYIDPEPLIALWPLKVPLGPTDMVSADAAPGVPLGSSGRRRARPEPARAPTATDDTGATLTIDGD
jgi:murein DD-endopeptidase MepM/ murein hydrolase activator NlpD